jgi:hypothetical protein
LNGLPQDKRTQVASALNWLEQHFPEFNDMIYEIRQGQKAAHAPKLPVPETWCGSHLEQVREAVIADLKARFHVPDAEASDSKEPENIEAPSLRGL